MSCHWLELSECGCFESFKCQSAVCLFSSCHQRSSQRGKRHCSIELISFVQFPFRKPLSIVLMVFPHLSLLSVWRSLWFAMVIDVIKPTLLSFDARSFASSFKLRSYSNSQTRRRPIPCLFVKPGMIRWRTSTKNWDAFCQDIKKSLSQISLVEWKGLDIDVRPNRSYRVIVTLPFSS